MRKIWDIFKEEEEKEKVGWTQRMRGIGELPTKEPLEVGIEGKVGLGVKAVGGVTLPEPEEEPKSFLDISKDPKMMELQRINFKSMQLWFKGLKESKDKWAFLKGEGQPPELKELRKKYNELAPHMYKKSEEWIQAITLAAYAVGLAGELIPLVAKATPEMLRKILSKTKIKDVGRKELHTALYNVTKGTDTPAQRKIFDEFIKAKEIGVPFAERLKGVKIPTVTPRFAFGTKLYAGLPADEIVKSIVEVGKISADMVKGLDPIKVSQVTQQLLATSPALASEFLKAIEKPKVPEVPIVKPEAKLPPMPAEKLKWVKELPAVKVGIGRVPQKVFSKQPGKQYAKYKGYIIEDTGFKAAVTPIRYHLHNESFHMAATAGTIEEAIVYVDKKVAVVKPEIPKVEPKLPTEIKITEKGIVPTTIEEAKEILKVDPKKPLVSKDMLAKKMVAKKASLADIEAVKGEKIDVKKPKDIIIALRDIKAVKKEIVKEPTPKVEPKELKEQFSPKSYTNPLQVGRELESYPTEPILLARQAELIFEQHFPINKGKGIDYPIKVGEQDLQAAITNLKEDFGGKEDYPEAQKQIEKAQEVLSQLTTKAKPVAEKAISEPVKAEVKLEVEIATPAQIKKAHAIANSKAMISEKGKVKPQYRKIAEAFTGKKSMKDMTPEEAEMFIDQLNRLPEPKYRAGKLVAPSIPRTMKLTTEGFFRKKYGEPTPIWLLKDQTYYATKLGIKPLVEPFEKGKMEFDLEFRKSSNLVDRMVNKLNQVAKTSMGDRIKSKVKNIPTKAESKMAELVNKYEATPPGLSEKEADVFKYFRNLSKDIWRRENEVREKVDLPPIKYKQAYFRHTADAMAKEMLEGKYPFPQGIKYWGEKMVGKKIFNPMEFHRKLSDDLIDLWSKDIRAVTKAMLWNGLKEIYLAQPAKFLNEQLNAISKDLPEYKNLSPRDQAAYDQTRVMPASTKKWLINYINQVIKGQETELDAGLNRIVTKSGLKGIFDKVLSPFGRSIGRKPITNTFVLSGRVIISSVMGWVPRQIMRNSFQPVQNLALYGVKATIKAFLPASVDKNLVELMSKSLFLKSYTGYEELPTNLMAKLEKIWLGPYGIVAVNNAKLGMKAAYWNILDLIKNPKFKKYGWADPQRTKDTPKGFLYPSEKEKLLKEMEFGASCTQYQYIPMGMPGIFRYKALIPLTRLQSWWMNYFTKFNREAIHRALKGRPSWSGEDGPTLPWSRRVNWLKYLIIGGAILTALGYRKSFMLGVAPTYLSPAGQLALGFYNYATATEEWQKKRALNQIYYSWKAFIPGSLAWRDFLAVWKGEKDLEEILFYGRKEEKKKVIPKSGIWETLEPEKPAKSDIWKTFE